MTKSTRTLVGSPHSPLGPKYRSLLRYGDVRGEYDNDGSRMVGALIVHAVNVGCRVSGSLTNSQTRRISVGSLAFADGATWRAGSPGSGREPRRWSQSAPNL